MATTATLSVLFEGKRLFVLANVEGLASFRAAERLLDDGLWLRFGSDVVVVCSRQGVLRELCPTDGDEFGIWPADANRTSEDVYWAALVPVREFLAALPTDSELRPAWWSISECELDAGGHYAATTAQAAGCIDTPGLGLSRSA